MANSNSIGRGAFAFLLLSSVLLAAPVSAAPPSPNPDTFVTPVGQSVLLDVLANDTDPDGDALTIVGVSLVTPPLLGGVASVEGKFIRYTPGPAFNGVASFDYAVTDGGPTRQTNVKVSVEFPPVANDDGSTTDEDVQVSIDVLANDLDPDTATLTIQSVDPGVSGATSIVAGRVLYVPDANFNGTDTFDYVVTDGAQTDTGSVTVTVDPVNDPPVADDDSGTTPEDTPVDIDVLDGDTDVDSTTLTIQSVGTASFGSTSILAGQIRYAPNADFSGSDSFTYVVSDGDGGTDSATVTVTVNPVDDTVSITGDFSGSGDEDAGPITGDLNASDPADGLTNPAVFTITGGDMPANGGASIDPISGAWSYTPDTNYHGGDLFTVTVTDDDGFTATQAITLTVNPVDDTVTITGDVSGSGDEDAGPITGDLNASDPADGLTNGAVFTIAGGDMPANGGASIDPISGAWSYTPDTNYHGGDLFTVTVTDDDGFTATQAITLTVNPVDDTVSITGDFSGSGDEDAGPITGDLNASDPADGLTNGAVFTITGGDMPANGGASIDPISGAWSYTPDTNYHGGDLFTVTVTDDDGFTATQAITLTVNPVDDTVSITGDFSGSGDEDAGPITGDLNASDPADGLTNGAVFTITGGDMPANGGASIDPTSGAWSYTPDTNYHGGDLFTVTVTDDDGFTATQAITLTVNPVDDAVSITGDFSGSGDEDAGPITGDLNASDPADGLTNGAVFTITGGDMPANGGASIDPISGAWSYTPDTNYHGGDLFTVTVTDDDGFTATQAITLTVNPVDDAVSITGDFSGSGDEDAGPITGDLNASDPADGLTNPAVFTITGGDMPANGGASIDPISGAWSYTPDTNYHGGDLFTVTVTDDDGFTATQAITLTVNPVDDTVSITGDFSGSGDEDAGPITGDLNASDPADGLTNGAVFTITGGDMPANGGASIDPISGAWSYTPDTNYHGGDLFTVTVTDDDGFTATQAITLTVNPVDDTVSITGDFSGSGDEDAGPITGDLNASDPADGLTNGAVFTITGGDMPANGGASIDPISGAWSYTPDTNYHGGDLFTVTVTDDDGFTATQAITLTVNPVDDTVTITGDVSGSGDEDAGPITGDLNASDPADGLTNGAVFTITGGDMPANGGASIDPISGAWSYTPDTNYHGGDLFTVTVTDDDGFTATQAITLTVNPVDDTVSITGDFSGSGDEDAGPITGDLNASDPADGLTNGAVFTITGGDMPANGGASIDPISGAWSYTPDTNYHGGDLFTVTVTDDDGFTATQAITLTVNPVDDTVTITGDFSGSGDEDAGPITGDLNASDPADGLTNPAVFTITGGDMPANGGASIDPISGAWSYTPDTNYHGGDLFTVTVTDDDGFTATQAITLTVNPVDDAVSITGDFSGSGDEDAGPITGDLNASDPADGLTNPAVFTITGGDMPANGGASIDPISGAWSYTPDTNYHGGDLFTVTVTDDDGFTATQAITLTVNPVDDTVTITGDFSGSGDEDAGPITGDLNASDPADGLTNPAVFTITGGDMPANGGASIDPISGAWSYTPDTNYHGGDLFTVTVTDDDGFTATQAITLTVNPVDDTVTITGDFSGSGDEDAGPITGDLNASDPADGLTNPAVFTITGGDMPANGGASIDPISGAWSYTPDTNYHGGDLFTVTVTDDDGFTATQAITLTVNPVDDAVSITGDFSGSGDEDAGPITGDLNASDPADGLTNPAVFTITGGDTPANGGASIDPISGAWSYTPDTNYHGGDLFTVTVTDDDGFTATQAITLTVNPVDDAVSITGDFSGSGDEDAGPITGDLNASDPADGLTNPAVFTIAGGDTPANGVASIDPVSGAWSYTSNADYNGNDLFTVTVTDDDGFTATQDVNITVTPVADILNDSAATSENAAVTTNVLANDSFENPARFVQVVTQGVNGSVVILDGASGTVEYTPNPDFNGPDSYSYTVASGGVLETATVSVNVGAVVNIVDDNATTNEDTAVTINALSNDLFAGTPVVTSVTDGTNGTVAIIDGLAGTILYTPAPEFHGSDSFTYTVTSGGVSETANVFVTVNSIDDPVLIGGDTSGTGDEDTVISGTLTATDPADGLTDGSVFSIEAGGAPANGGAVIDPASGLWDYTPNADYNGGDLFTVTVTDDDGFTDTQPITINVLPVVDIADDSATTPEDTPVTTPVFANDSFEDPARLVTAITQGGNGTVSILDASAGTLEYTPDADFNGTDSFDYTVTSGGGMTETATVTVVVNAVVDIADDSATTDEDTPVVTDVFDNDSFAPSALVSSVTQGLNGTVSILDASDGTLEYTPAPDFNGSDSYTYTVTSGTVTETATVSVDVNAIVDIADDTATTPEDTPVTTDVLGNDGFDVSAVVSAVTQGTNGTVAIVPGGVEYTPTPDYHGSDSYTYTVTSGGVTETASVSVTITAVADIVDDSETTAEDTLLTTSVLANDSFENAGRTVTSITQGSSGTVAIVDAAAGTIAYTPDPDFNGSDSYTYTVTSAGLTETATVSLVITPVVDIADDSDTTAEDAPVTTSVLANDDFEDPARVVTSVTQGASGTVAILDGAAGTVQYTPNADFNGSDSYSYTVTAGTVTETATVSLIITPVVDIADDSESTDEDTPVTTSVFANDSFEDPARIVTSVTAPANGTVAIIDGAAGSVQYTPFADFNGTDSYTYTVSSGTVTETATVSVAIAAVVDIADDTVALDEDTDVTTNVLANDSFDDPARSVTSITAVANGTVEIVDAAAGTIRYTPGTHYFGPDSYTYTVSSGGVTETASVSITVANVDDPPNSFDGAPAGLGDDTIEVVEDTPFTFPALANDVQVDGAAGDPMTITSVGAVFPPSNGTVTTDGTTITYTPNPDYYGMDTFGYTVRDSFGTADHLATVLVDVTPVDDAPRPVDDTPAPIDEDTALLGFEPLLNDVEVDTIAAPQTPGSIVITEATVPDGRGTVTFTDTTVDYTPPPNFFGNVTITYTVKDGEGDQTATADIDVVVDQVDDAPDAQDESRTMLEDEVLTFDPRDNDTEVDSTGLPVPRVGLTIVDASVDIGAAVILGAGEAIEYTPPANFNGTAILTYEVRDQVGPLTDTATVTITVVEVDDVPIANNDVYIFEEDSGPQVLEVTDNDDGLFDDPITITIAGVTQVIGANAFPGSSESAPTTQEDATGDPITLPNGTVSIDGLTIIYESKDNFSGDDFFRYTIEDGDGQISEATVDITISPVNDRPTAPAVRSYTMTQDTLLSVPAPGVLVGAFDADGDPLSAILQTPLAGLQLNEDGSFTYEPPFGFVGSVVFTFLVNDGTGTATSTNADGERIAEINVQAADVVVDDEEQGVVDDLLPLAQIPLELVEGVDPNVLIIMDDSGSMDFSLATNEDRAVMTLSNFGREARTDGRNTQAYDYLTHYPNNTYYRGGLPSESELLGDDQFGDEDDPNEYGVWRGRSHFYNKIYYNPDVTYRPWRGIGPDGEAFPPADETRALLNPTNPDQGFGGGVYRGNRGWDGDLRRTWRYGSFDIPRWQRSGYHRDRTNEDYYIPRYYLITEEDYDGSEPEWFTSHCLIEIRPASNLPDTNVIDDSGENNKDDSGYTDKDEEAGVPICEEYAEQIGSSGGAVRYRSRGFFPKGEERTDCSGSDFCTYDEEIQNFANWFVYYRNREYTVKSSLGSVVADVTGLRVGYAVLNNRSQQRTPIRPMEASFRGDNKSRLLDQIYRINSAGGTPLRVNLDRAGRHFACRSSNTFTGSDSEPGDESCPVLDAPGGLCQQNFTLLFTDGVWNSGLSSFRNVGNADGNDDTDFDGAFFADSRSNTLADIAMHYYERDLHPPGSGGLDDLVPTSTRDRALAADDAFENGSNELTFQNMRTFTVGFGVDGRLTDEDIPDDIDDAVTVDWGNPFSSNLAKIDDLRHAALNGRGDYLSAADPSRLEQELRAAFEEFGSGAGAASAVSFNSQQVREDTVVFRGFYNTDDNTGDLVAQAINFAENRVEDDFEWSAAALLEARDPAARVIATYNRDLSPPAGVPFRSVSLSASQRNSINSSEVDYLRGDRTGERPAGDFRERPGSGVGARIGDIINSSPVFVGPPTFFGRDREPYPNETGFLYSEFVAAQQNRPGVVYVGANDGFLHAVDAANGTERWAYMPDRIIPDRTIPGVDSDANDIEELTEPTYEHLFYVDGQPAISDVFMRTRGAATPSWRTILVGTLRAGGKGLFAIDVTNPDSVATEAQLAQRVLWEFTDQDDTIPRDNLGAIVTDTDANGRSVKDLGFTYSVPTVGMTNATEDAAGTGGPIHKWAAIFGNGYNATYGFSTLFVNFLEGGRDGSWAEPGDFVKLRSNFGPAPDGVLEGLPNGLGEPRLIDLDGNGTVDFAYAGDIRGNLFRFDLTASDPTNWSVTRIFRASYSDGTPQPITTQPIVTRNTQAGGVVVLFGTGSYFTTEDGTDTSIQSIYGIWDRIEANPFAAETAPETAAGDRSLLVEQDILNLFDTAESQAFRSVTSREVNYAIRSDDPPTVPVRGWYIDLDAPRAAGDTAGSGTGPQFPGERAVRNFDLRGGFLFLNTVIPRDNFSCDVSPGGFGLAINPLTGGAGGTNADVAFDINNDGSFDDGDLIGGNIVAGLRYDDAVPTDSTFIGTKRFTQLSDRRLDIVDTNTGFGSRTGRLSWRELE